MRLLPAHTHEAAEMAARLHVAMAELEIQLNCRASDSEPPTLPQTRELMAKAMGYEGGWVELSAETAKPHIPVYIDRWDDDDLLAVDAVTRLATLLGFDYMHGAVWSAWSNAGVGYSPSLRRRLEELSTPWGLIHDQDEVAPGIRSVTTGGHGGFVLSAKRQQQMPLHLRLDAPYYEEDCDWALVVLAFPDHFADALPGALGLVGVYQSQSVPRLRCHSPEHEAFLARVSLNYVSPDQDPLNRLPSDAEQTAISYLARCVFANRRPVRTPDVLFPTLQDWVSTLAAGPWVDGALPMLEGPWKPHWGQWERLEQETQEREQRDLRLFAEVLAKPRNHSSDDVPPVEE